MMTQAKLAALKEQGKAKTDVLRSITTRAEQEGRELTPEEDAAFAKTLAEGQELLTKIRQGQHDLNTLDVAKGLAADMTGTGMPGGPISTKGQRLSFKGMASGVVRQMLPDGIKSLAPSGAAVAGVEMQADPLALGKPALSLLDVIPVVQHSGTEFAFMRQTVRTNAAVVAEGAVKPTSVLSVTRIEQSLAVVAHLSEGRPEVLAARLQRLGGGGHGRPAC